jgi:type IV pilus modification protein PilV
VYVLQKCQGYKCSGANKSKFADPGFSLIEVLIASTVFSLGLAGFTALLLSSIIGSAEARREGIASMAAASLAEQIRLNPTALVRYINPPEYVSRICSGNNSCSPEPQADYDFRLWQLELADSIKNARGLVCHDETPQDGIEGNSQCDGTGPLVIKIFWNGRNSVSQGSGESNKSTQRRFTLQIS